MMKLLVLGCPDQSENHYTRYTGEILRAEGLNWFAIEEFGIQNSAYLSDYAAVILTRCVLTRDQIEQLVDYVKEGGRLVCFRPCVRLGEALGLEPAFSAQKGGYVRLDLSHPACRGLSAAPLQNHGLADHWRLPAGDALAVAGSVTVDREETSGMPWLIFGKCGRGTIAVFTADLPALVAAVRQGDPDRANTLSGGIDGIYRASELFVGHLDESCAYVPQADVFTALLANVIDRLIGHPTPRFWYYPQLSQRSVL
ncbi:MAG: hypothetical protein MUQ10_02335, partial [Anaerolineae bacterium]|nr:hypothetical protein [Anaerolineae bacterium]